MRKKTLVTILCACLLVSASVMATLAYLTDRDSVLNTFTVGDVQIELDEATVNAEGKPLDEDGNIVDDVKDADRTEVGNNYHLIPGQTYVKDPTVTIEPKSEKSYVRMLVTFNKLAELDAIFAPKGADLKSIFGGYDESKWIYEGETEAATANMITYEFRYFETVENKTDNAVALDALFDTFTLPGFINGAQMKTLQAEGTNPGLQISIEGHAIQAATFADDDDAWAAFEKQWEDVNN